MFEWLAPPSVDIGRPSSRGELQIIDGIDNGDDIGSGEGIIGDEEGIVDATIGDGENVSASIKLRMGAIYGCLWEGIGAIVGRIWEGIGVIVGLGRYQGNTWGWGRWYHLKQFGKVYGNNWKYYL